MHHHSLQGYTRESKIKCETFWRVILSYTNTWSKQFRKTSHKEETTSNIIRVAIFQIKNTVRKFLRVVIGGISTCSYWGHVGRYVQYKTCRILKVLMLSKQGPLWCLQYFVIDIPAIRQSGQSREIACMNINTHMNALDLPCHQILV